MQARSRARYVRAWESHITQLATLALAASTPESFDADRATYERIRGELMAMVQRAADQQKFTHRMLHTVEVFLRDTTGDLIEPVSAAIVTAESVQEVEARFTRTMRAEGTIGDGEYITAHVVRGSEVEVSADA